MIDKDALTTLASLGAVGGLVGFGQLLAGKEVLTPRIVIGRFLSSCGLGASAASIVIIFPALPLVAQLGLAAGFASLGTSALEIIFKKYFGDSNGGK